MSRVLGFLSACVALGCALGCLAVPALAQQAVPIQVSGDAITLVETAEFTLSKKLEVPREAEWQTVALPDSWRKNARPRDGRLGWYRVRFTVKPDSAAENNGRGRSMALYIPRVTNNVEVFLNGTSIGVSGRLGPVPQAAWNLVQYFVIPGSVLRAGENELAIRLHPDGYPRAGIARIHLGDAEALDDMRARRHFVQTLAPQLITAVLIVMCTLAFAVWARRRNEQLFLFFAVMGSAAVVRLFHHYLRDVPTWVSLLAVPAICWMVAFQVKYALHFANRPLPKFERFLVIFAALSTLVLYASAYGFGGYQVIIGVIYSVLALLTPAMTIVMVYQLTREPSSQNALMIVGVIANSLFGIHDFLNYQEWLGFDQPYLIPLGLPILMLAMAALLVHRFVETLRSYEALNAGLANRVFDRERELELAFARERELDQQRATAEERQRLMRDMHDGLGGHLMSSLALMKRGQLSQGELESVLTDCIDELKLTIDSLEPVERDLLVVLGNLRYRLEPRLNAAGISLEWAVTDLPPLDYLEPERVREILLIVQEAFTNTLKHANATRITLSTGVDRANNAVLVRITDDGKSFVSDRQESGRGLANMRTRARKLRGTVEVLPMKGGGTCVNLKLPLRLAPEAAG